MESRIGYKLYEERKVFVLDFSYLKQAEFLAVVFYAIEKLGEVKEPSYFLILINDCEFDREVLGNLKNIGKFIQPLVVRSAVVGVTPKNRSFFNIYLKFTRSKMRVFDTIKDAINYFNV